MVAKGMIFFFLCVLSSALGYLQSLFFSTPRLSILLCYVERGPTSHWLPLGKIELSCLLEAVFFFTATFLSSENFPSGLYLWRWLLQCTRIFPSAFFKNLSCFLSEWLSVIIMNCLSVDLLNVRIFWKWKTGSLLWGWKKSNEGRNVSLAWESGEAIIGWRLHPWKRMELLSWEK